MADYPTGAFNPATRSSGQTIAAAHINDVQAEIRAIELALVSSGLAHNLLFVDATYDIGASGASRPRDLFLSRNAVIGGTLAVTGVATFTATPVGVTVADSWVPVDSSGAGLTLTDNGCRYIKVDRLISIFGYLVFPATANGANALIGGLPFPVDTIYGGCAVHWTDAGTPGITLSTTASASTLEVYAIGTTTRKTNANLTTVGMRFSGQYRTTA